METPHGRATVHLDPAAGPRGALVLGQGARDPFGIPPAGPRRTVLEAGDHGVRTDLPAVAAAVRAWLPRVPAPA